MLDWIIEEALVFVVERLKTAARESYNEQAHQFALAQIAWGVGALKEKPVQPKKPKILGA